MITEWFLNTFELLGFDVSDTFYFFGWDLNVGGLLAVIFAILVGIIIYEISFKVYYKCFRFKKGG